MLFLGGLHTILSLYTGKESIHWSRSSCGQNSGMNLWTLIKTNIRGGRRLAIDNSRFYYEKHIDLVLQDTQSGIDFVEFLLKSASSIIFTSKTFHPQAPASLRRPPCQTPGHSQDKVSTLCMAAVNMNRCRAVPLCLLYDTDTLACDWFRAI